MRAKLGDSSLEKLGGEVRGSHLTSRELKGVFLGGTDSLPELNLIAKNETLDFWEMWRRS
jgi:hypothetical protein